MTTRRNADGGAKMIPTPITEYVLSPHAEKEISRRGLSQDMIRTVLEKPEQQEKVREGRVYISPSFPENLPNGLG